MNQIIPKPDEILADISGEEFESKALEIYRYQYFHNEIYRKFADNLGLTPQKVKTLEQIPFLPIELFKKYPILSNGKKIEAVFRSSTTTGNTPSVHYVASLEWYDISLTRGFHHFYGDPKSYCIIGLLPSYLERADSSLVYMVNSWIQQSRNQDSGFYLYDYDKLIHKLNQLTNSGRKTLLVGVTFALVELAEQSDLNLKSTIILETGGMKGRRREIVREELHSFLRRKLRPLRVDSEYGMTELLSQSYKIGPTPFKSVPWKKLFARDINDPLGPFSSKTGILHVIDLANVFSCSFIATQDLGQVYEDGSFEVLGRYDHAEARGCNLMLSI